jgi:hypothetical protein
MNIAPKRAPAEAQEFITELWKGFFENFEAYRTGAMKLDDEVRYRILSSPGPSQYHAFNRFYVGLIKGEENWVLGKRDDMHMHDFKEMESYGGPALLEFLQNLISAYDCRDKNITMVSGSFWRACPDIRKEIISLFMHLCEKKANVRILTQAKEEEQYMADFSKFLKEKSGKVESRFGIEKRLSIHFIRAGDDYLYYEFPHTESTQFRLNMFLDLSAVPLKEGKTKGDLLGFLDDIIEGRL